MIADSQSYDVAIIGGGIAGLSVALRLPEQMRVALFTKGQLGESNTRYAQGGLAVALGDDDSPELHFQDTIAAGAGLCDEAAVRILVEQAPAAVRWLIRMGVQFDRAQVGDHAHATPDGLLLGREGAHSRWRVLHAGGDATGAEIERALLAALQTRPTLVVYEETYVQELLCEDGRCVGVRAIGRDGEPFTLLAGATILANGGAGGLWLHTSNPAGATADGLALAWRAGAALADLEFMQFHPTVLMPPGAPDEPFLITEAVRGEGAYLRNAAGERFMPRYHPDAELAPRDVVARAILSELLAEGVPSAFLDLRHLPEAEVYQRFPTIAAVCRRYGLDLAHDLIPVAPAAHYFMGGVAVDTWARTTLLGLYAVGEVSCTGVHGANRLASNSLLEGLVFGRRAAQAIAGSIGDGAQSADWPRTPSLPGDTVDLADIDMPVVDLDAPLASGIREVLQDVMWERVSLRRNATGLLAAQATLRQLAQAGAVDPETANMLFAAQAITACALARAESRGAHSRADYPAPDPAHEGRHTLALPQPSLNTQPVPEGQAQYAQVG